MSLVPILKAAIEDVRAKRTPGNSRSVYTVTGSEIDPLQLDYYERLRYERRLLIRACKSMLTTCGGSEHWNGETHESLKLMEQAIADVEKPKRIGN